MVKTIENPDTHRTIKSTKQGHVKKKKKHLRTLSHRCTVPVSAFPYPCSCCRCCCSQIRSRRHHVAGGPTARSRCRPTAGVTLFFFLFLSPLREELPASLMLFASMFALGLKGIPEDVLVGLRKRTPSQSCFGSTDGEFLVCYRSSETHLLNPHGAMIYSPTTLCGVE